MSGAMENRAAVFASSSQDVEVYRAGGWWPGSLLGWRHEPDGSCQVWVRAAVAGVERSTWTDLGDVRLPERAPLHPVPASAGNPGQDLLTSTISLFAVRDGAAAPVAVTAGSRPGGRRRAPEPSDSPAWGAATQRATTPSPAAPAGRHRAPAPADGPGAGRHRAADTGVLPAIPAGEPVLGPPTEVSGRALPVLPEPAGAPGDREFHTRPLRLATSVPQPRAARWED